MRSYRIRKKWTILQQILKKDVKIETLINGFGGDTILLFQRNVTDRRYVESKTDTRTVTRSQESYS